MRKLILLIALLIPGFIYTQHVGIGTATPSASAILDVSSTTQGMLVPRMDITQRTAIASPAVGLLVYQTDGVPGFYFYNGVGWISLNSTTSGWNTIGNAGTNPINNFIGTTDNQPLMFRTNNLPSGTINPLNGNVALGKNAAMNITTGANNVSIGNETLKMNKRGSGNITLGLHTLLNDTLSNGQIAIGHLALRDNQQGYGNIAIGDSAMSKNTTGRDNLSLGPKSLYNNTIGQGNIAVGSNSMSSNIGGSFNLGVGAYTLQNNDSGSNNIALGTSALSGIGTGNNNVAIGVQSQLFNLGQSNNVSVGYEALLFGRTTEKNIAIGSGALKGNEIDVNLNSGDDNIAIGYHAAKANENGNHNIALGSNALMQNETGSYNIALGGNSQLDNQYGIGNIGIGSDALLSNIDGHDNIAIGTGALAFAHTNDQIAIGRNSLSYNQDGINNVALGAESLPVNSTGSNNVMLGKYAGHLNQNGSANTGIGIGAMWNNVHGSSNVGLGNFAGPAFDSMTNTIAIGAGTLVYSDYSIVLGDTDFDMKVGIGDSSPDSKLDIEGTYNTVPMVQITQYGSSAPALKIASSSGNNGGIELENASFKVSGINKMVFQVTTPVSGSINALQIPNSGFANSATDIIIVTSVFTPGQIITSSPTVQWSNPQSSWFILHEDQSALPTNKTYNVMVFKQ